MHRPLYFLSIVIFALTIHSAHAAPKFLGISHHTIPKLETLTFNFSEQVKHKNVFALQNPERLVMDLDKFMAGNATINNFKSSNIITSVRFGNNNPTTSRVVIDLRARFKDAELSHTAAKNNQPYKIKLTIYKKSIEQYINPKLKDISPEKTALNNITKYPTPILKPKQPQQNKKSTNKPMIVIDAGHGGKDPGALGYSGKLEKNITLALAKEIAKYLESSGKYRTKLTRNKNEFIKLRQRVAIARKAKGDVLLSIHADSAPVEKARGVSIYTVSETASDKEAAALAAQENAADYIGEVNIPHKDEYVSDILLDLTQRDTKNKASILADLMAKEFKKKRIKMPRNAHRYAGFRVLKAPDIPSVLIETGFISNRIDEKLLMTRDYRQKIKDGILKSLNSYFARKK